MKNQEDAQEFLGKALAPCQVLVRLEDQTQQAWLYVLITMVKLRRSAMRGSQERVVGLLMQFAGLPRKR